LLDQADDLLLAEKDGRTVLQSRDQNLVAAGGHKRLDLGARQTVQRAGFANVDAGADQGGHLGDDVRTWGLADRDEPDHRAESVGHRHLLQPTTRSPPG